MPARHQRAHEDKTNLYHLILDLQYAQAKAGAPANQQNVSTPCQTNNDTSSNPLEDAMCNWQPTPAWTFPESLRFDWLKSCAWDFGVANAILRLVNLSGCMFGQTLRGRANNCRCRVSTLWELGPAGTPGWQSSQLSQLSAHGGQTQLGLWDITWVSVTQVLKGQQHFVCPEEKYLALATL